MNEETVEKKEPVVVMASLFTILHCLWLSGMSMMLFVIGLEYFIKDSGTLGNIFGYGYGITAAFAIVALIAGGFMTLYCGAIVLAGVYTNFYPDPTKANPLFFLLIFLLPLGGLIWSIWSLVESPPLQAAIFPIILLLLGLAIFFTIIKQAVENIKATLVGLAVMLIGIAGCIWQLWAIGQNQAWFISRGLLPIPLIAVFALLAVAGLGLMFKETKG